MVDNQNGWLRTLHLVNRHQNADLACMLSFSLHVKIAELMKQLYQSDVSTKPKQKKKIKTCGFDMNVIRNCMNQYKYLYHKGFKH